MQPTNHPSRLQAVLATSTQNWVFYLNPNRKVSKSGFFAKSDAAYEKLMRQITRMVRLAPHFSPSIHNIPVRTIPYVEMRESDGSLIGQYSLTHKDVQDWMSHQIQVIMLAERLYLATEKARRAKDPSDWCPSGDTSDI
ncbi:MAG: hypothetical protein Q7S36_01295 [Candidatus Liptonbacteria bacterium]|nr:hypothetical protein [Candidatus Liptonbacteria bacterium]